MKGLFQGILVILWLAMTWSPAAATYYSYTTIDVPGYLDTQLAGINDAGQYSGACGEVSFVPGVPDIWHAVFYDGSQFTTFDVLGGEDRTQGQGIDARGWITGYYHTINPDTYHGFMYDHSNLYSLDVPGSTSTFAAGINSLSQIVGFFYGPSDQPGFLYTDGNPEPYETISLSTVYTLAIGINDAGEILGSYWGSDSKEHGFILANGAHTTLDYPQAVYTKLNGKNTSGQIVGIQSQNDSDPFHGFVYDGQTFTTVEPPGAIQSWARGINNRGQIIGTYLDQNYYYHGFLATPVKGLNAVYQLLLID